MSAIPEAPETVERRGPGRPRKNPRPDDAAPQGNPAFGPGEGPSDPVKTTPAPVIADWPKGSGLAIMPDEEMEQYGGDLSALDSWSKKARRPLASWRDGAMISSAMPDLLPKGLLVNRHAPEQLFHFAYLAEDGSPAYQQALLTMRKRGYKPATVADWYVHSLLRDVLVPEDGTGRLTLGGALKGGATVVYAQDETNYRRILTLQRAQSDEVQKTAQQRNMEANASLAQEGLGGITTTYSFDEDEQ